MSFDKSIVTEANGGDQSRFYFLVFKNVQFLLNEIARSLNLRLSDGRTKDFFI